MILGLVPSDGPGYLRYRLLSTCAFPPRGTPQDCAVSGGADSLALLVLAASAGCRVTAWHVDHGLRSGSAAEADVVADAARRYGSDFRSVRVRVEPGPNLEDRARRARFAALPHGVATGHTADDQAETVLLALLRGTGLDGLTGMGPGGGDEGTTAHPLLALRRADTEALCAAEGLEPIRDPTNSDTGFRRNRIRLELMPLACDIAGRDVVPLLTRTAALLRADAEVLDEAAAAVDATDARMLATAAPGTARRAVRRWLARATPDASGVYPPSAAAVERILAVARGDAGACEVAGVGRVGRHHQRLVIEGRPGIGGDGHGAAASPVGDGHGAGDDPGAR